MQIVRIWVVLLVTQATAFPQPATAELWSAWRSTKIEQLREFESATISSIYRNYDGEVFFATAESLFAFDGQDIRKLSVSWATNNGYPLDRVLGFSSARDGTTWLYTERDGIYFKTPKSNGFRLAPDLGGWSVGAQVTAAINIEEPAGVLNVTSGNAFFLDTTTRRSIRIGDMRDEDNIVGLGTTPNGHITLINSDGWFTYYAWHVNGGWLAQKSVFCSLDDLPVGKISTLDGVHFFAASRERRIVTFRVNHFGCLQTREESLRYAGLQATQIRDIRHLPKSGYLAIATDEGLYVHNGKSTELLNTKNSLLRSNQVTAIAELSKDQLLVGSYLGLTGAFKSDVTVVTKLGNESLPEITSISGANNRIFISSLQGLYTVDKVNSNFTVSKVELPAIQGGISALATIGSSLFVGTTNGKITVLDVQTNQVQCVADTQILQPITGFAPSPDVTRAYGSALSGQIIEISNCGNGQAATAETVFSFKKKIIGFTAAGNQILITDFSGIRTISLGLFDHTLQERSSNLLRLFTSNPGAWVSSVSESSVLLGSPEGKLTFKESLYSTDASQPRTIPDTPYAVETDEIGRTWIASKTGLWVGGEDNDFELAFRIEEMSSIAFEYNASHRTSGDTMVFGGIGGIVIIDSPAELPRRNLGTLLLRSAELGSKEYYATDPQKNFGLLTNTSSEVVSFWFSASFEIGRSYDGVETMLSPIESEWNRHRSFGPIEFGPLPPGNYTFRARGANALGVWSENEIVIPITVRPPAWLSWWAILFYGLAAVLMFLLFNRLYMRHLVREARLAYGEEAARAFSRLEDDWQEQREATDRLLRSIPITVSTMIHTIRSVVKSQSEAVAARGADERALPSALATIDRRLQALQQQQNLCVLSTASQTCEAQQLINELVVLVTSKARFGSRYIVLDETAELTLDAGLGQAIAIMMMELLELMVSREPLTEHIDPIVTTCIERTSEGLRIKVADPDAVSPSETLVDETLAATFALLEDFGGSIVEKDDLGYEVEIKLPEAKGMT